LSERLRWTEAGRKEETSVIFPKATACVGLPFLSLSFRSKIENSRKARIFVFRAG
jgi:hypothetical protein